MFTNSECCYDAAFAPIIGKPYEGKLHVRFDEGVVETGKGCPSEAPFNRKGRETDMVNLRTRRHRSTLQTANVLDKLPKSVQPYAKNLIHEMYMSPTKKKALKAYHRFLSEYEAKYPKATACLQKDEDVLFTFYDFPADHWRHIRTTNPIESTFATVRHRTRQTKGCGSRTATLMMVYKLASQAEKRWRKLNNASMLAHVIRDVAFIDGVMEKAA
jgi:putative transposase